MRRSLRLAARGPGQRAAAGARHGGCNQAPHCQRPARARLHPAIRRSPWDPWNFAPTTGSRRPCRRALQYAVRLLQMSSLDFAATVRDTLGRNPFLESEDGDGIPDGPDAAGDNPDPAAQKADDLPLPEAPSADSRKDIGDGDSGRDEHQDSDNDREPVACRRPSLDAALPATANCLRWR